MRNVKFIYPSKEGGVTEVISKEDAIALKHEEARRYGYIYTDDDDALQDLLCCPTASLTNDPIGKTIGE